MEDIGQYDPYHVRNTITFLPMFALVHVQPL
jgi:hypothetical protein